MSRGPSPVRARVRESPRAGVVDACGVPQAGCRHRRRRLPARRRRLVRLRAARGRPGGGRPAVAGCAQLPYPPRPQAADRRGRPPGAGDRRRLPLHHAALRAGPAWGADAGRPWQRRLLPPGSERDRGAELPRPDLQGQAGRDVVGRQGAAGPRRRPLRDRRPVLPRDRALQGGPTARRPARVPDHPARHRARHEQRDADDGPHERRRAGELARGRQRDPRARDPERPGALRLAQPRPRRARRVAPDDRAAVRLLPRELDRHRRPGQPADLGAKHLGRLQGGQEDRRGDLAARREEERLRDGPRYGLRVAARRAVPRARPG